MTKDQKQKDVERRQFCQNHIGQWMIILMVQYKINRMVSNDASNYFLTKNISCAIFSTRNI